MVAAAKKLKTAMLLTMAIMLLSGCLNVTADELYKLPMASDEYIRLEGHINQVLTQGAEFSPPISGPNRQSVQLKDLSGDGTNEVITFFSVLGDSTLKIVIFEMVDGDYAVAEIIDGIGTDFESVRYVDMDGDGIMEIVVGWQMSAALKHMSIFSIRDFHSVEIAWADYSEMIVFDIDGDGNDDVIVFRLPTSESGAVAEMFKLMPDGEVISLEARLSSGIDTITRVLTGRLIDGTPAIFVDSEGRFDGGGIVTDILVYRDGSFTNISIKGPGSISEETVRTRVFSADINQTGIIKVPMPRRLMAQSETAYYAIDWYAYNSMGHSSLALTTYHNNFDEWFLILPFDWRGRVSVRREDVVSGERTVIFSYIAGEDGPYQDFLKVYRISGEMRMERASLDNRVMILADGAFAYAFELLAEPNSFGLTFDEALIRDNFRLIHSEWLVGMP